MKKIMWIKNLPLRVLVIAAICWLVWEIGLLVLWALICGVGAPSDGIEAVLIFTFLFLYFIILSLAGLALVFISVIVSLFYEGVKKYWPWLKNKRSANNGR